MTQAASATTGKVSAASPSCCLLPAHEVVEVEVEVEVEGLQKASVGKEEVTAEAQETSSPRPAANLWVVVQSQAL